MALFTGGAKTYELSKVEGACPLCEGELFAVMHKDADGNAEMLVIKCLKDGEIKRLYRGRREPSLRNALLAAAGVPDRVKRSIK
jgi:hypothetical protein